MSEKYYTKETGWTEAGIKEQERRAKTDAQRFPADGRGILCGHNFPPRQCPYAKCGYREALERLEKCEAVCNEIQRIMVTYREQKASPYGVDTPGGLEHMGDVWNLLAKWDAQLDAARAAVEE